MIRVQARPLNLHNDKTGGGEQRGGYVLTEPATIRHFPSLHAQTRRNLSVKDPWEPSNVPVQVTTAATP